MEQIDLVWEATFYLLAVLTQLCHLTEDQKRRLYANTGCVTLYIFKKLRKKKLRQIQYQVEKTAQILSI